MRSCLCRPNLQRRLDCAPVCCSKELLEWGSRVQGTPLQLLHLPQVTVALAERCLRAEANTRLPNPQ